MGIQFIWDKAYEIGNEEIDRQHRNLFELANSLKEDLSSEEACGIAIQLIRYCREHFFCEEQLMSELDYPKLKEHRALHDNLIVRLASLNQTGLQTAEDIAVFRIFVFYWLIEHVMQKDKDFFEYVKNHCSSFHGEFVFSLI